MFFDKTKKTEDIWFYEVSLIDGKKLTKKNGISNKHFEELIRLYKTRPETLRSWLIPVNKVLENGTNLSASHYNPNAMEGEELLEPKEYIKEADDLLKTVLKKHP